jgi:ABC-2 type transport system ATP-binding protein
VIEVEHVEKHFSVWRKRGLLRRERIDVRAVDDLTFSVAEGSVVGYIGPNGAGKSTTV